MNVFFTIDVETYTGDYAADVDGYGKGLPYLLEKLRQYNVEATFFVETLGATRWGIEPVRDICSLIMDHGQDIQLHIHPKVARIEKVRIYDDKLWKYDKKAQLRFFEAGLEVLYKCGVESVVAFRAGDLAANVDTLAVMEHFGLYVSSNRDLDMKSSIHTRINNYFPIINDVSKRGSVLDIPVTSFRSRFPFLDGFYRHFEICALGAGEMKKALSKMLRSRYRCAVVLTHPGEFFVCSQKESKFIKKNCRRFEALLQFVASETKMETNFFRTSQDLELPTESPPAVWLSGPYGIIRIFEQALARIEENRYRKRNA